MLSARTLFIIGAGASCEYGLPDGGVLKSNIRNLLDFRSQSGRLEHGDPDIHEALRVLSAFRGENRLDPVELKRHVDEARELAAGLRHAASIDRYLDTLEAHEGRPEMARVGKLAIVKAILAAERTSTLWVKPGATDLPSQADEKWLSALFSIMESGVRASTIELLFRNAAFICFNYDRCVEHFFSFKLANFFRISLQDAQAIVRDHLNIVHPYGTVGGLPWQGTNSQAEFGDKDLSGRNLVPLAEGIRTFTERVSETDIVSKMKEMTSSAERVVFLGFGFHSQNMDLLSTGYQCPTRAVYATVFGQSAPDCAYRIPQIARLFNPGGGANGIAANRIVIENTDAAKLLWNYAGTLSR